MSLFPPAGSVSRSWPVKWRELPSATEPGVKPPLRRGSSTYGSRSSDRSGSSPVEAIRDDRESCIPLRSRSGWPEAFRRGTRSRAPGLHVVPCLCTSRNSFPSRWGAPKWCVGTPRRVAAWGKRPAQHDSFVNDDEPCCARRPRARAAHVQPRRTDVGLMLASAARHRMPFTVDLATRTRGATSAASAH